MERQAKAQKMAQEAALIAEKILTERVKQQQMLKGIEFDEDTLAMERAKVVAELEHAARSQEREDVKTAHEIITGVKSQNREDERVGLEREKVSMSANKPGYNEKGMKSNNLRM